MNHKTRDWLAAFTLFLSLFQDNNLVMWLAIATMIYFWIDRRYYESCN